MKRSLKLASMNLRVGLFVTITLAAVLFLVLNPIRGVSPFSSRLEMSGFFNDVGGLKRNSPVYLTGMEVGRVQKVSFTPAGSPQRLMVLISVEKEVQHLLRQDTKMAIVSKGLLGDKFVELTPGDPSLAMLQDGTVLTTQEPQDMMPDLKGIKDKVESVLSRADTLLALAQSRTSSVGSLFVERQLYEELVGAIKEIRLAAAKVNTIAQNVDEKILDKNLKEGVDSAVASAKRIATRMDAYTEKIDSIRWYLDVTGNKYEANQFETQVKLRVVPNKDRYYMGGLGYFNQLGPHTGEEKLTYDAGLGFRILTSPVFFWGGMKRNYFAGGLDLRLFDETLGASADVYRFDRDRMQTDLAARWRFFNAFSLTGGADDVLNMPRYRGGLMVTYDDQDLTAILIKIKTGL
jgi:hypothetical protein